MNEVNRIPSPARVQSVSGQGGASDGKPRLERRRRKKKGKGGTEDEAFVEQGEEAPTRNDPDAPRDAAEDECDEEERGQHVDVRA